MDGTLLNENFELTPTVIETVAKARKTGLVFVIVTGRDRRSALPFLTDLGIENTFIGSGGAQIWLDGKPVGQTSFSAEQTHFILGLVEEFNTGVFLDQGSQAINFGSRYYVDLFMHVSDSIECKNPIQFFDPLPSKISLCQEPPVLLQIRNRLAEVFPMLTMGSPFSGILDINPGGGNKGNGLSKLGEMLGISKNEIVAVGDSENDVSLFQAAGFTIAMGNSDEVLRSKADLIAPANSENGIAWVLNEIMKANAELTNNSD